MNSNIILGEYVKLGGKYVTYGSDSHKMDTVGKYFNEFMELVKKYNLIPCYYRNRKRITYL